MDNMDLLCFSRSNINVLQIQKRIVAYLLTLIDGHKHSNNNNNDNNQNNRVFIIGKLLNWSLIQHFAALVE